MPQARLNGKAAADARAFAGIAYRITPGGDRFEAVYLRPLNGWKTNPPSAAGPARRPVLRLPRLEASTGYAKASSQMGATKPARRTAPDEWTNLRIEIDGTRLTVAVNRTEVLTLTREGGTRRRQYRLVRRHW